MLSVIQFLLVLAYAPLHFGRRRFFGVSFLRVFPQRRLVNVANFRRGRCTAPLAPSLPSSPSDSTLLSPTFESRPTRRREGARREYESSVKYFGSVNRWKVYLFPFGAARLSSLRHFLSGFSTRAESFATVLITNALTRQHEKYESKVVKLDTYSNEQNFTLRSAPFDFLSAPNLFYFFQRNDRLFNNSIITVVLVYYAYCYTMKKIIDEINALTFISIQLVIIICKLSPIIKNTHNRTNVIIKKLQLYINFNIKKSILFLLEKNILYMELRGKYSKHNIISVNRRGNSSPFKTFPLL